MSYTAELAEAYETAKVGDSPARAREDFEDVLRIVCREYRPVVIIDDTEHFVRRDAEGGVDREWSRLSHHGVRALADLGSVDLVVSIHPKYRDVEAVQEVTARFGFTEVSVPTLRSGSDSPGLAEILSRRLARHDLTIELGSVVSDRVLSQLEAQYFANAHDFRAVLDLAADAASAAAADGSSRVEPRHLQPLLDHAADVAAI